MRDLGLLQRRVRREAELHQSRQLFELLPTESIELWQMDVTCKHLPQGRWWYIVSVIDYYSRYLLTCFLTPFQNATAVSQARVSEIGVVAWNTATRTGVSQLPCMEVNSILSREEEKLVVDEMIVIIIYALVSHPLEGLNRSSN